MNYSGNKKVIQNFYYEKGLSKNFEKDDFYLERSFNDIKKIWFDNLNQIKKVKYLMIAEAPLWGKGKKYIYNPDTNNSQFFYRSDLGDILNQHIVDKRDFIKMCNEIGLLIVDISPFPLNPTDTSINYRDLPKSQYRRLVSLTIPTYFEKKIIAIADKKSDTIKVFFRYGRVKKNFQDIIARVLIDKNFIRAQNEIEDISQNGGGIDKTKLRRIIQL
ncbi:MAG TPA: hypothetical protein VG605_01840 [Puia sp.]|nr:hypothetical protein [Puia sp.]